MESANLHHQHQNQDQSSSLANRSAYGVPTTHMLAWTPNASLNINTASFNQSYNGVISNSRQKNDILVSSPNNNSMIQDLGLQWGGSINAGSFSNHQSPRDLHLARIKEELSTDSFPKFTEMLNISPSSIEDSHLQPPSNFLKIINEQNDLQDLSHEKLLLKTISSGFPISTTDHQYFSAGETFSHTFGSSALIPSRGNFSQIYPSINISNLNQSSSPPVLNSFDMSGSLINQPSYDDHNLGIYKESLPFCLGHLQQSCHRTSSSPNKLSPAFTNETAETKRHSSLVEPKTTEAAATKKSRLESSASCPPFKVRKEKLGDRIAALQQLVAPFGKTDTASVLMEAIGYIKFLQNQVETLSVPYMKSSRNKTGRIAQGGSMAEERNEELKRDLRSRGLCLVPLSCMSYVTNDGGEGIWPPPSFGRGT